MSESISRLWNTRLGSSLWPEVGGQNSTNSTLLTKSKNSSRARHCHDRWVGVKKSKKSTQTKKYLCWRWRVGGQNLTTSTLLTKSKNSSKASLCQDRWVGGPEIDANEEISVVALEGGGSEFDEFDAFDEKEKFF